MNQEQEKRLGTLPAGKLLFQMALPAIAAQIINVLYNIVDRMYIGHIPDIGDKALTGVGVCMPLIMAISAFAALASMGSAPRASIMMGKGDEDAAEEIMNNSFIMLLIIGVILTVVFLIFGRPILMMFGASENTIGYAIDYMRIYACGTLFVQLALGMNAFITAQGFAKTSMLTVLIGAVLNIILDPVFIFCVWHGSERSGACDNSFTAGFSNLGAVFSAFPENCAAYPAALFQAAGKSNSSVYCARSVTVYHAVHRRDTVRVFQYAAVEIRR